jgi:hypothetical protein
MVLVPMDVAVVGPSIAFLPFMPSYTAINIALLMNTVAYWSFCGAVQIYHKRQSTIVINSYGISARSWFPPAWMIVTFAILGITGIALRFGTPKNLIDYFTDPQSYLLGRLTEMEGPTTPAEAASTFLMYFFPFSLILLWCRGAYQDRRKKGILSYAIPPILIMAVALSASLNNYNKAGFVIPIVAVAAVIAKRGVSGNILKFAGLGTFVAVLLLIIFSYRLLFTTYGDVNTNNYDLTAMNDLFQDYGTAPQYLGFLLQSTDYAENPSLGRVFIRSSLSPVPIVGKSFREQSGTFIYNRLLSRSDQPPTTVGELFLDFSVFGVIAGFLAVGFFTAILQNSFEVSNEPFEVYILQLVSICLSYFVVCGIEEVSQLAIYSLWPVYCFMLYRSVTKSRRSHCEDTAKIGISKLLMTE